MPLKQKAQVEFIYILAIVAIIIALTSISYFRQSLSTMHQSGGKVPVNVKEEINTIKDSMINFMRKSSYMALKKIESRGGYVDKNGFISGGFTFMNDDVPYWVKCDTIYIPSNDKVKSRIETETAKYIKENKKTVENFFGKNVSFNINKLKVGANILDTKIEFNVYLPTKVRGYDIEQPYHFSLATEFGRIYNFAKDFSDSYSKNRYFEYFTLASIYTSKILGVRKTNEGEDRSGAYPALPTLEELHSSRCGTNAIDKRIDRSKSDLSLYIERAIKHAITNILWWVSMPDQTGTDYTKTFSIEEVNNKKYTDLNAKGPREDIIFTLPDNFSVDVDKEIHTTLLNPRNIIEKTSCISNFDACMRTYNFNYDFNFPVNVRVRDKLLKQYFNFGVLASIKNMLPGGCQ